MHRGLYITGTDTGIGKTRASVALLQALRATGLKAVGMKPVASGCEWTADGWRNEDALALQAASHASPAYALVNPCALPLATAPTIAAHHAGMRVQLPPLLEAYRALAASADIVVVEGVGGWLAPLAEDLEQADLVRALDLDVVLVVGLRLGCISHARLSERAIRADGVRLAGWIGNAVEPGFDDSGEYFRALSDAMATPCLGRLAHAAPAFDEAMAATINTTLRQAGLPAG
jgi:dethiobiotin synthetase